MGLDQRSFLETRVRRPLATLCGVTALLALSVVPALAGSLVLKRVVLSSGGVGYYEYAADVGPDETVSLDVPLDQVDDVLGSLIALTDQGRVAIALLPGRQPLEQYFAGRSFSREALVSTVDLLVGLVGAEIAVDGPHPVRGKIVGVAAMGSSRSDPPGADEQAPASATPLRHRVTVLGADGLQQFVLEEAATVTFTDRALQAELGDALSHIASFRAGDRRRVTLKLPGSANHPVRVGYVASAPLWKVAYRLVLPPVPAAGAAASPAHLQGWAVLENMSGNDWSDVALTLVSGSPVTFRQALYQSYIVPRQTVPIDLGAHVVPMTDQGSVGLAAKSEAQDAAPPPVPSPAPMLAAPGGALFGAGSGFATARQMRLAPAAAPSEAAEAPSQVSFAVPGPVSLPSGQSATLPIIEADEPAERISLYQPATDRTNPLATVTLRNAGATALPPGMLTLYEEGSAGDLLFVGDARMAALPAGESRLLSYAVDLKTRIASETRNENLLARISTAAGTVREIFRDRRITTYRLTEGPEPRRLVLEVPRPAGAKLVAPAGAGAELTATAWRIPVELRAGESRTLDVTIETEREEALSLSETTADQLADLVGDGSVAAEIRLKLQPIVALRRQLADVTSAAQALTQEQDGITADQQRLRANMGVLQADASLRRRYVDKLTAEENRLDALAEEQKAAAERVRSVRAHLLEALGSLSI